MHPALAIAAKDLRQKARDRSALILAIIAPMALAFLFSSVLGEQTTFRASYVVVDLDGGTVARALVDGPLLGLRSAGAAVSEGTDEAAARGKVEDGSAAVAVIIPKGFTDAVQAAQPTELRVVGSVNATLATQVAQSVLEGFASSVEGVQVAVATVVSGGAATGASPDPSLVARVAQQAVAAPDPIRMMESQTRDRLAGSTTYYAAAMAVLFLFFAAQFGVVSLHAERRNGTLARMLAAPVSPRSILLGKVLVSIALGMVSMGVVAVGTTLLMHTSWGDPLAVSVLLLAAVVAASGIALLVVGLTNNEEQAGGLASIVAMVLAVLGGSFFPLSQAPEGLASLSLITPHAWFLRGIDDLASGEGIAIVLPSIAVLAAIGLVMGGAGMLLARKVVAAR